MLVFNYGAMNSGKSLALMKTRYNLMQSGKLKVATLLPNYDSNCRTITSRAMDEEIVPDCIIDDYKQLTQFLFYDYLLIDEAQFLSDDVIDVLKEMSECMDVYCYGLMTTTKFERFEASNKLDLLADKTKQLKSLCENCGKRLAKFHYKQEGEQHDKQTYTSVCYDCWKELNAIHCYK